MFYNTLQVLLIVTVVRATTLHPTVLLNDGNRMPAISFGTIVKVEQANKLIKPAVIQAIEAGCRQIDTAAIYQNEKYVGQAIADVIDRGVVTRDQLWITTKIHPRVGTREGVSAALQESLKNLNLPYVDTYMLHSPDNLFTVPDHDFLNVWKGMEDAKNLNLTRSIGVSNCNSSHIDRIIANSEIVPAVNEIEVNPTFTNEKLIEYCKSKGIAVLSYAPFGYMVPRPFSLTPIPSTFEEPVIVEIAKKYGKLANQVIIRYLIDRGTIPVPKSVDPEHIKTNFDVFDFQLTAEEVESINKLNKDARVYYFDTEPLTKFMNYYGMLA